MFRRKRSSSCQPLTASSSQHAQSAASHAFLNSQPSSASLSSAAAATALRALSPAPSPVGNVQTKRMLQRRASLSQANVPRPASQGSLRRSNSSGSMSSRTFREQSPRRPATSSGLVDAPPLPSIPAQFAARRGTGRRSLSVDASIRPSSAPLKSSSDRGVSVDRVRALGTGNSANRAQGLSTVPELERSASRSSVNFSYPMNSSAQPPSPQRASFTSRDVSTPPPRTRGLRSPEMGGIKRSVSQSGRNAPQQRSSGFITGEGSPSSTARGGSSYPIGTAIAAAQAASLRKDDATSTYSQPPTVRPSVVDRQATGQATVRLDHRYPSRPPVATTRELDEGEELAQVDPPMEDIDPKPVSGKVSKDSSAKPMEHTKAIHNLPLTEKPPPVKVAPTPEELPLCQNIPRENRFSPEPEPKSRPQYWRQAAESPRSAHFSSHRPVAGAVHVHQPPPRSVSPVKSALKQQRKGSLSQDGRAGAVSRMGQAVSEMSDGTSAGSDDGSRLGFRKKSARVSFDDEAEIVGVAASPPTSPESGLPGSPQGKSKAKSRWFHAHKRRAHQADSFGDYEFDDVLKPRPALPSFGSIRGNREGEQQDPAMADLSDNESTASMGSDEIVAALPLSGDYLGGTLERAQSETNQSSAGLGHATLSNTNDDRYTANLKESTPLREADGGLFQAKSTPPSAMKTKGDPIADPSTEAYAASRTTPSVTEPTSTPVEEGRSSLELFSVPGGFPRTSVEQDRRAAEKKRGSVGEYNANATGLDVADNQKPNDNGAGDESDGSIYDDAAEESEGGKFGSISAVMSSGPPEPTKPAKIMDGDRFTNLSSVAKPDSRALYPVQEVEIQQGPDSPVSAQCPSPPPKSKLRAGGQMAKAQKRTVSVAAHGSYRHSSDINDSLQQPRKGSDSIHSRQGPYHRRAISVGPILSTDGATDPDELWEEARDFHSPATTSSSASRPMSNGSDPSSMSKRSIRPVEGNPPHVMKRTLRSGTPTLREQSPRDMPTLPGEQRGQRSVLSGASQGRMPMTLRTGNKGGKASFFSSVRSPKSRPKLEGVFKPRLTHSDDEDAGTGHRGFLSRYAESSDDEDPVTLSLPPVRGIPRRHGMHDGDSTELEDSSEDERRPQRPVVTRKPTSALDNTGLAAVARSRGMTLGELEEFLQQQPRGRKPGLFHWLGVKKPKDVDDLPGKFSFDSASRWDPALEEPHAERIQTHEKPIVNGYGRVSGTQSPPASPQKIRKGLKKYKMTDNWSPNSKTKRTGSPEPMAEPRAHEKTPVHPAEPAVAEMTNTNSGENNAGLETVHAGKTAEVDDILSQLPDRSASALDVVIAPAGRKKRLSSLRKALGLRA